MQGYLFFSDLGSSNPSKYPPIERLGCGIEYGRVDMTDADDLARLSQVMSMFAPFSIGGDDENTFDRFYDALRAAATYPDGSRPCIYGYDGRVVCVVDLT